jgi:hypothetical protein
MDNAEKVMTMVTIEHNGNGYRMKFSNPGTGARGFSVKVADVVEMKICLDHYYGNGIHAKNHCPLCREVERKQRQPTTKEREG